LAHVNYMAYVEGSWCSSALAKHKTVFVGDLMHLIKYIRAILVSKMWTRVCHFEVNFRAHPDKNVFFA